MEPSAHALMPVSVPPPGSAASPAPRSPPGATWAEIGSALAVYSLLVLLVAAPAICGYTTLGPDSILDYDLLYRSAKRPAGLVLSDRTPAVFDLPRDLFLARQLWNGHFPAWNPLSAAGAPLWAEQGGPFFPLKLPFYLLSSVAAHKLFLCLRLVAAGLGAYLLARYRGLPHWPAVVAGATFELCGALIEAFGFSAASAQCVLPWVVLGAARTARHPDRRAVVLTAIALCTAALGGHPTVTFTVFIAFAAAMVAEVGGAWRRPRRAAAIAACSAAAVLLGLALAAPSLLPFAELKALSESYKDNHYGGWAWEQSLHQSRQSIAPALFVPHLVQSLRQELWVVHLGSPMLGVVVLVLALAGILGRGIDRALAAILAASLIIVTVPPGFGWVRSVPYLREVLPYYAWLVVALPLTQAAGAALQQSGTPAGRRRIALAFALVVVGAASLAWVEDIEWSQLSLVRTQAVRTWGSMVLVGTPYAAAAVLLAGWYAFGRRIAARRWTVALGSLAIAELVWLAIPFLNQPRSAVLDDPPSAAVSFLQQHLSSRDGRVTAFAADGAARATLAHPLTPMLFALPDLRGLSAVPISRYVEYMHSIDLDAGYFVVQDFRVRRSPLIDLAAVRFLITPVERTPAGPNLNGDAHLPLAYADRWVRIYENTAALPRVRLVHRVVPAQNRVDAGIALRAAAGTATHAAESALATTAIIEPDAAGSYPPPVSEPGAASERVHIIDDGDPDRLVLSADLVAPGLLVIADTYYPGWRAWVDGEETPIYPANLLFRAVHLAAGTHTVVLRYQPLSFRLGMAVSAAAWLALGALWWSGGRTRLADQPAV
jgi:hypothetical protein